MYLTRASALLVLALPLTGCGAIEHLLGIEEHQARPECATLLVEAAPDSTIPEHVRQFYPQVTLLLEGCPET